MISPKRPISTHLITNPDEKSALTNLARLYEKLGDIRLAAEYQARIHSFEDRNPYYHYALAEAAYRDGDYARALTRSNMPSR